MCLGRDSSVAAPPLTTLYAAALVAVVVAGTGRSMARGSCLVAPAKAVSGGGGGTELGHGWNRRRSIPTQAGRGEGRDVC